MGIYGVEVHGACKNQHIRIDHLLNDPSHVILENALAAAFPAVVAGDTGVNILFGNPDLFHLMSGFCGTHGEPVTQKVGIAALSGASQ